MVPGILRRTLPLAQINRVSPSRFALLRECALREVWAASGAPNLLPASPAARFGSAIHQLLEEAGNGAFKQMSKDAIGRRLEELVVSVELRMRDSWLEGHLIPLKSAIPDFEVRKLRAIQRATDITQSALPVTGVGTRRMTKSCELWLETSDGLVGGYIDQVDVSSAGAVLRDYKSGQILDESMGAGIVKETYQVQLKLYAAIYAISKGVWPARLELVPLQGAALEVPFTHAECETLLGEARNAMTRINSIVANGSSEDAAATLAAPSARACRYCLFRPTCNAYKRARQISNEDDWPADVWGTVEEKRLLGNGKVLLTIESNQDRRRIAIRGLSASPARHPALVDIENGTPIALFGLKRNAQDATHQESPWSIVYRIEANPTPE